MLRSAKYASSACFAHVVRRNPSPPIRHAPAIDLGSFCLLKGLGGALLREKIVAEASKRLVIIADTGKVPTPFGGIVPIEIVKFGAEATFARLEKIGPVNLRQAAGSSDPYVTDNGNYIVDLTLPAIPHRPNSKMPSSTSPAWSKPACS